MSPRNLDLGTTLKTAGLQNHLSQFGVLIGQVGDVRSWPEPLSLWGDCVNADSAEYQSVMNWL